MTTVKIELIDGEVVWSITKPILCGGAVTEATMTVRYTTDQIVSMLESKDDKHD